MNVKKYKLQSSKIYFQVFALVARDALFVLIVKSHEITSWSITLRQPAPLKIPQHPISFEGRSRVSATHLLLIILPLKVINYTIFNLNIFPFFDARLPLCTRHKQMQKPPMALDGWKKSQRALLRSRADSKAFINEIPHQWYRCFKSGVEVSWNYCWKLVKAFLERLHWLMSLVGNLLKLLNSFGCIRRTSGVDLWGSCIVSDKIK